MGSYFAPFPQAHRIQESRVLSKKCCICSGMILGRSLACGTCQIHLHHACHEHLPSECCKMGAVHFKAHCEESVVLSLKDYAPLIQLIQWDEFEVLITLRHQLISHDEAVTGIMTILDAEGQAVSFLKRLIQVETEEATDSSLLFRSNSLLTRAWTAFMGLHGQGNYLKSLQFNYSYYREEFLTNVLNPILLSFLDLEMDIEVRFLILTDL